MFEHSLVIIGSYMFLGGGIKYIDQAYDLRVFSKRRANIIAILCGIIMAYLIITDPSSIEIFLALIIALAITRKIDNIAFYIGTGIALLLPIIFGSVINIQWIPFGILIFSGILDELGNDWADNRKNKRLAKNLKNEDKIEDFAEKFFLNRFSMKIAIGLLVILSFFDVLYLYAFVLFDLTYLLMDVYSTSIKVYSINRATR